MPRRQLTTTWSSIDDSIGASGTRLYEASLSLQRRRQLASSVDDAARLGGEGNKFYARCKIVNRNTIRMDNNELIREGNFDGNDVCNGRVSALID